MPLSSHPLTASRRFGTVAAIPGGLTVGVNIGGDNSGNDWDSGVINYCPYLADYVPTIGDTVELIGIPGDWTIIGPVGNPTGRITVHGSQIAGTYDATLPIRTDYGRFELITTAAARVSIPVPSGAVAVLSCSVMGLFRVAPDATAPVYVIREDSGTSLSAVSIEARDITNGTAIISNWVAGAWRMDWQ
jgi:hypothetical protein